MLPSPYDIRNVSPVDGIAMTHSFEMMYYIIIRWGRVGPY